MPNSVHILLEGRHKSVSVKTFNLLRRLRLTLASFCIKIRRFRLILVPR